MRRAALAPLLVASGAFGYGITFTDVQIDTYWRTGSTGPATYTETRTTTGEQTFQHNDIMAPVTVDFYYGYPLTTIFGGTYANHTGYIRQEMYVEFTALQDSIYRFSGSLVASTIESGTSQHAFVQDITDQQTLFVAGGGAPLQDVTGFSLFSQDLVLLTGHTYGFAVTTSWVSSSWLVGYGNPSVSLMQYLGAPVPEPATYGLALGGLALVGAVVRRRKFA